MKARLLFGLLLCLSIATIASAQALQIYPDAKLDQGLSSGASRGGTHVDVYTTTASFEKVAAFYKAIYKENKAAEGPRQIQGSRNAVFILDGAPDVLSSKHYLTVKEFGSSTNLYDAKAGQ